MCAHHSQHVTPLSLCMLPPGILTMTPHHTTPHHPSALQGGGSRTASTDVVCPMYARIPQLLQLCALADQGLEGRPVVLCEYAHSMGNSTGNIADYWACFESHRCLQGGFIWDWADQALVKTSCREDGRQVGGRRAWVGRCSACMAAVWW
jgi:hypothetical protein